MPPMPSPIPEILPVYPLREQVVFPHMVLPLFISSAGMATVEAALRSDRHLFVVTWCSAPAEPIFFEDLSRIGTLCRINQTVRFPDGGCKVVIEGVERIRLLNPIEMTPAISARVAVAAEEDGRGLVAEALAQSVNALLKIALAYGRPLPGDVLKMIDQIDDPGRLADLVAVYLNLPLKEQQRLLELLNPVERLKEVYLLLTSEVQKIQVRGEVQVDVAKRLGRSQKEYILREQLKQIQEELGDDDPQRSEISELRQRIAAAAMPEEVARVAEKEVARLERINPASAEYTVARTYLDYLCSVPWQHSSDEIHDLPFAQQVLDEDHYNLKEVKERILEHLAVRMLRPESRGPILCFVGPPGVGKTSLGRSIARATGRKFIRMSLGGMRDEAEIRGHRRTYIGALPGRIIQEMCRADSNNPVFMLDEVDKIGQDFRGDPASALLEVLDPEQNNTFTDHYLDVPFDLSRVMFITTANILDPVAPPLKDRMEVITLAGYGDDDKQQIAFTYLIPKQIEENGLKAAPPQFTSDAIAALIRDYTREAGVRGLERQIAAICRKLAKERALGLGDEQRTITRELVENLLGPRKYFADVAAEVDRVGVVTGLAWTEAGGDIIFVEASRMAGKKELLLTGSLGEVMQESAKAALSYVRAHAVDFAIDPAIFANSDIHIHVPSGATPKDGPSAGITIATSLISLFTNRPARRNVAMTGELTLTGRILPIGGVKEKILAARRAGVTTILLPDRNREHLHDLDAKLLAGLHVRCVATVAEVVEETLLPAPE
jgi:ATP-dependent Lon protease